jgi:hypothetical protein
MSELRPRPLMTDAVATVFNAKQRSLPAGTLAKVGDISTATFQSFRRQTVLQRKSPIQFSNIGADKRPPPRGAMRPSRACRFDPALITSPLLVGLQSYEILHSECLNDCRIYITQINETLEQGGARQSWNRQHHNHQEKASTDERFAALWVWHRILFAIEAHHDTMFGLRPFHRMISRWCRHRAIRAHRGWPIEDHKIPSRPP